MTWVVGGRHVFCARCIADIQVTLQYKSGENKYFDGVKKIHNIGDDILIAFAGTIKIAFEVIEKLQKEYKNIREERFAEPIIVAEKLRKIILHTYKSTKHSKADVVEFILLIKPIGIMKAYGAYKLVSPDFKIYDPSEAFELIQIGSGSKDSDYNRIVLNNRRPFEIPGENGGLPSLVIAVGKVALKWVAAEAMEYQKNGVSQHMHIAILSPVGYSIEELPKPPHEFPDVATTWKELETIIKTNKMALANVVAIA